MTNMIELHYLADNSPVSVNANFITHFYECKEIPLRYGLENNDTSEKIEIHCTRICLINGNAFNVMESYEQIKNIIDALKNRVYITNRIIQTT